MPEPFQSSHSAAQIEDAITRSKLRAFCNFNGVGTIEIRSSYNVSSLTDHGVGSYSINFTLAVADENHTPVVSMDGHSVANGIVQTSILRGNTSSKVQMQVTNLSSGAIDVYQINVAVFR